MATEDVMCRKDSESISIISAPDDFLLFSAVEDGLFYCPRHFSVACLATREQEE